jgi:transcriptional regulator with PAS, ATPase and Fis domain
MDRIEILDRLHAVPFLGRLAPSQLDRLVSESELRRFAPAEALLAEGDGADCVFLLLSGSTAVTKRLGTREEAVLAVRSAGEWVGEMALFDDGPRSATVTAREVVEALVVPRAAFLAAITSEPEAAADLLRMLTTRLRESDGALIESLTAKARSLEAENRELAHENRRLADELDSRSGFEAFVGESIGARRVRQLARRAARSELSVLLLGETGTGKEVLARAIHAASERAAHRFVAVNCALLSETLLESELFGHLRGAFTGATDNKPGLVEAAERGTLFLDEVADLPWAVQGALLRFLELREYRRLGDTRVRRADVRVMAATHVDLDAAVAEGAFRRDLVYRLDVLRIEVPPLRERGEDVERLLRHAADRVARRLARPGLRVGPSALEALSGYAFPGNVRELENEVERLYATLEPGETVEVRHLSPRIREADPAAQPTYGDALRAFKVQMVARALREGGGSQAEAARLLGVHRSNLTRMVRELGLREARSPVRPRAR